MLQTSAFKLYGGQLTFSTRLLTINLPCYTLPPTQYHSFFRNFSISFIHFNVLNYNLECDWFTELYDNKLSDNDLASELASLGVS